MTGLKELIDRVGDLVSLTILLVAGVALLAFFWGLVKYIFQTDNEKEKDVGKNIMLWGTIALFVMVSVWGIIEFLQGGNLPIIRKDVILELSP